MKRLTAAPWATSCIVCQEAADKMASQPWEAARELLADAA
jgi:RNA polymerase-binding transcription factor DksA